MTFDQLMAEATRRLRSAEIDAPAREARWLMALAANLSTTELISRAQDSVPGPVAARFEEMLHRREGREPFQHIEGSASFFGLDFICDARALVPRADSEVVVETALSLMPRGRGVQVADLGTGSGCLLTAILFARGGARGTGVEADANAASLARQNFKRHGVERRAALYVGRWETWTGWGDMDVIVSNPPYIASHVIETLAPEVRLHDPRAALDGGPDGLATYRDIVRRAAKGMKPGAHLVFEIGHDQKEAVSTMMQSAGFDEICSAKDLGGRDRVVWGHLTTG